MNSVLQLLGKGLDAGIAWAEADKTQLLAAASAEGVTLANVAEKYADSAISSATLPAPLNLFPKPVLVEGVNAGISALLAEGQSQENVLFGILIGWAQSAAKALGG